MGKISKKSISAKKRMRLKRDVTQILERDNRTLQNGFLNTPTAHSFNESNFKMKSQPFNRLLADWASYNNISHRAINELLKILKGVGFSWLPNDSRTLLKTPRTVNISEVGGGQYWFNGIEKNLKLSLSHIRENSVFQLNFNVDGVPLFKSSSTNFWPILMNIHSEFKRIILIVKVKIISSQIFQKQNQWFFLYGVERENRTISIHF